MAARVTVVVGPAGAGKTARLLARCRERSRAAAWLAPTRRAAAALRPRLFAEVAPLDGPWLGTLQEFADTVVRGNDPRTQSLSSVQRRLLVETVVADLHERRQLEPFARVLDTRGFSEGLLNLLSELRRQYLAPGRLTAAAAGPREAACARLYAGFCEELDRRRLLDAAGRCWRASALLRPALLAPFEGLRCVFADGFTDFTLAEQDLLEALALQVEEIWITLPGEANTDRTELFAQATRTLGRLCTLRPTVQQLPDGSAPLSAPPPSAGPGRRRRAKARVGAEQGAGPLFVSVEDLLALPPAESVAPDCPRRPAGLIHLERQLFRPVRAVVPSADADGVALIEAPGAVGEARLVAREVKRLLREGTPAGEVLVVLRDLGSYADLLRETFGEYGIPLDMEGTEPLSSNPAVAVLLRAVRLPEDDWPFAGVTALLRNGYFLPSWEEMGGDPEMPYRAEALLRMLGEPRGRAAYLSAVARWAERQQPGLEDEDAEESRRRRIHELAERCRPFLERFIRSWEGAPGKAALADHVASLRDFAEDLGITRAAARNARDAGALARLWEELSVWIQREGGTGPTLDRRTFQRRLSALAGEVGLARTPRGPGRVRVLSAELARYLEADHVFLLGLGERGFPRLAAPPSLLDDADRQALRQAGIELPQDADLLPDEMLLFYQVVTRARRRLVLSYPAVDERGLEMLPGSFLAAARDCFAPDAVRVTRRRMLLDGYDRDEPLSPAEHRIRLAACGGRFSIDNGLSADLAANLNDTARLVRRRFEDRVHNPFDGLFQDPEVIRSLSEQFGPERVFSPTALEDYVACPFRFFLRQVLRLGPLEDPREEIEVTRRGQAVHRALARLHRDFNEKAIYQPDDAVAEEVRAAIAVAVAEDVARAPSPAAKALWGLEGRRLERVFARYPAQWRRLLEGWRRRTGATATAPRPHGFEIDFGLPAAAHGPLAIRVDDIEVRVSGRIDRVDVTDDPENAGFWVIDYKTGRPGHYTTAALTDFRRLQLTLYALAVEEVLLAGRNARPLGLGYWLIAEDGAKMLWLDDRSQWPGLRETLRRWVASLADHIRRGVFVLQPRETNCTATCPFGQVCRITQARAVGKPGMLPLPVREAAGEE
jgi:ATP-dependent helicase/DNAse subunit B